MNTENPIRRPGPHAPLPNAGVGAAVSASLTSAPGVDSAPRLNTGDAAAPGADDPRARAAKRAQELRDHLGSMDEGTDKFYIDPRTIPDGWSYEWKTKSVLGKENPAYDVAIAQRGWEAVPLSRHPEMMPRGYPGNTIERDGMILMERPAEITNEVKAQEYRKAREQVQAKENQLGGAPPGQFERANKDASLVKIKKSFENVPIPTE